MNFICYYFPIIDLSLRTSMKRPLTHVVIERSGRQRTAGHVTYTRVLPPPVLSDRVYDLLLVQSGHLSRLTRHRYKVVLKQK